MLTDGGPLSAVIAPHHQALAAREAALSTRSREVTQAAAAVSERETALAIEEARASELRRRSARSPEITRDRPAGVRGAEGGGGAAALHRRRPQAARYHDEARLRERRPAGDGDGRVDKRDIPPHRDGAPKPILNQRRLAVDQATIHLIAMARAAGVDLTLHDFRMNNWYVITCLLN